MLILRIVLLDKHHKNVDLHATWQRQKYLLYSEGLSDGVYINTIMRFIGCSIKPSKLNIRVLSV